MLRTAIITGPAFIEFDGGKFYSKGDIDTGLDLETFEILTSAHGKVDERVTNITANVSFEPAGEWEHLAVLYPYGSTIHGASVFTGTDKPLKIHCLDGKLYTFKAAAVTQMPNITASATKTLLGQVRFTCLRADNSAWDTVDSFLTIAGSGASAETAFDPANIKTQPYVVAWGGSSPWNAIETSEGVAVDFDLSLQPIQTDTNGIIDMRFERLAVMARMVPLNAAESDILTALKIQGSGAARGRSLQSNSNDLTVTGTGVSITLKKAQLKTAGYRFGAITLRNGEVGFVATKEFVSGVGQPLFTVGT